MKKINSESLVCKKEEMSTKSSKDFPDLSMKLKKPLTHSVKLSPSTLNMDSFPPAPLTWELV